MSYLTIVLFSAAITVVWTQGRIFRWFREHGPELWQDFAGCPLCSGVWIGAVSALAIGGQLTGLLRYYEALALGAGTGCVAWAFVAVLNVLGSIEVWTDGREERSKYAKKLLEEGLPELLKQINGLGVFSSAPRADDPGEN